MSRWVPQSATERQEFEVFARAYRNALTALARGLATSDTDAEDLIQETMVRSLERWNRVRSAENPYAYVRAMMINLSATTWRRRRREDLKRSADDYLASDGDGQAPMWRTRSVDGGVALLHDRMAILTSLRAITERQRVVIVLRYIEELPDEEIAGILGITEVTVRTTAMRGLRAMKVLVS